MQVRNEQQQQNAFYRQRAMKTEQIVCADYKPYKGLNR